MAQHTPGPWLIDPEHSADVDAASGALAIASAWDRDAKHIRNNRDLSAPREEECIANARLIAAAPDLLVALYNLVELCDDVFVKPKECDNLTAARAAIAKAEGRS
jgi:hypothetical protein